MRWWRVLMAATSRRTRVRCSWDKWIADWGWCVGSPGASPTVATLAMSSTGSRRWWDSRPSGTTLDIVHAEDGPPIAQRTLGLGHIIVEDGQEARPTDWLVMLPDLGLRVFHDPMFKLLFAPSDSVAVPGEPKGTITDDPMKRLERMAELDRQIAEQQVKKRAIADDPTRQGEINAIRRRINDLMDERESRDSKLG
jgi:hypothetical protein